MGASRTTSSKSLDIGSEGRELIGAIYDAALDSSLWQHVLRQLTVTFASNGGVLASSHTSSLVTDTHLAYGWDREHVKAIDEYYVYVDPMYEVGRTWSAGKIHTDRSAKEAVQQEYMESEAYNDFFKQVEGEHLLLAYAHKSESIMSALCFRRHVDYGEAEKEILAAFVPHVRRSLQIHDKIACLHDDRDRLAESLDRLTTAVLIVNEAGRVERMNAAAEAILGSGDGLSTGPIGLVASTPALTSALQVLIAQTAMTSTLDANTCGGALRLGRPSGRRPLEILVAPLPASNRRFVVSARSALVFLHDPEIGPRPPEAVLAVLYGLTQAEARLAAAMAGGESLSAFSDRAQITMNTARWTLKQVFAKTDTNRQAELVRLLVSGPASLTSPDRYRYP